MYNYFSLQGPFTLEIAKQQGSHHLGPYSLLGYGRFGEWEENLFPVSEPLVPITTRFIVMHN